MKHIIKSITAVAAVFFCLAASGCTGPDYEYDNYRNSAEGKADRLIFLYNIKSDSDIYGMFSGNIQKRSQEENFKSAIRESFEFLNLDKEGASISVKSIASDNHGYSFSYGEIDEMTVTMHVFAEVTCGDECLTYYFKFAYTPVDRYDDREGISSELIISLCNTDQIFVLGK